MDKKQTENGDDLVTIPITISCQAYERARQMASDPKSMAGELAGMMSTAEFIERFVEIMLEHSEQDPEG
jgi:stage V sporulation protein SpoVS